MQQKPRLGKGLDAIIPKKVRDEIGLKPGDRVTFIKKEWGILMVMVPVRDDLDELMGSVDVEGRQDFEQIREQVIIGGGRTDLSGILRIGKEVCWIINRGFLNTKLQIRR